MKRSTRATVVAAAALAVAGASVGAAVAAGGDEERDVPITGIDLDRASKAALAHTGGGTVSGTEVGDEESYYEVEVTLDDGSQVDVQLDRSFDVVSTEADGSHDEDRSD